MRTKAVLGSWLLALTLAWLAVAAAGPGLAPLPGLVFELLCPRLPQRRTGTS